MFWIETGRFMHDVVEREPYKMCCMHLSRLHSAFVLRFYTMQAIVQRCATTAVAAAGFLASSSPSAIQSGSGRRNDCTLPRLSTFAL